MSDPTPADPGARLREIQARVEKATKGPWFMQPRHHVRNQVVEPSADLQIDDGSLIASVHITAWKIRHRDARPDADFIAHARDDVPFLLARVAGLETALRTIYGIVTRVLAEPVGDDGSFNVLDTSTLVEIATECEAALAADRPESTP